MSELQYIQITKLHHHPDNPRKNLGDVTELAESIKAKGVLQNLTVVPWNNAHAPGTVIGDGYEDDFAVVIGNRRLEAGILADVDALPCVVSDMTYQEQISTMMVENMQRADLTVYEQAQGFQMMLDLGDNVDAISEKTGFSVSTIRRRVKLLELDPKEFKKSEERGATLLDYMELDKIKDTGEKNRLLKFIGSSEFRSKLEKAITDQKKADRFAYIKKRLSSFAVEVDTAPAGYTYVSGPSYWSDEPVEIPDDAGTREYVYTAKSWGCSLYRKKTQEDLDEEAQKAAQRKEESDRKDAHRKALKEVSDRCCQLRRNFVFGLSLTSCKKLVPIAIAALVSTAAQWQVELDNEDLEALGLDVDTENDEITISSIMNAAGKTLNEQMLVRLTYLGMETESGYYQTWGDSCHCEDDALDMCYDYLIRLGYEMSEEEKAFQNGTHELFQQKAEAENE